MRATRLASLLAVLALRMAARAEGSGPLPPPEANPGAATGAAGGGPPESNEPRAGGGARGASAPANHPQFGEEILVVGRRPPEKRIHDEMTTLDESRDSFLLPKTGATAATLDRGDIASLPQGTEAPLDDVLYQLPGVSYDSAISNPSFHVRNEYANVQYRLNGIRLPDGVSGFGQVMETGFVGRLQLLDGVLPAQYGLRTAGVIDITTRAFYPAAGRVGVYGGTLGTISPSAEYGGQLGRTEYFATGRYYRSDEGLENAMSTLDPIHDRTEQGKAFVYLSTLLGESSRLTDIAGLSLAQFQIPNVTGLHPLGDFGSPTFNSAALNENQLERYAFNVLALQVMGARYDTQLALTARYATVHFIPDETGDLVFNDVASDVTRESLLAGVEFDGAYRLSEADTVRAGLEMDPEWTRVANASTVLPLDAEGTPMPTPLTLVDDHVKLGLSVGGYLEDEWKVSSSLTLDLGLRFDYLRQFVTASALGPRAALVYEPWRNLTLHAGYARYFTPPMQVEATPPNLALFQNTTLEPAIDKDSPAQPERSHYFDLGLASKPLAGLEVSGSVYYKLASDLLDDGQFGAAAVLTQVNYARAYSYGAEFTINYRHEGLKAYGNLSLNSTRAEGVASSEYLFDPDEFAYLNGHYHVTDDAQAVTASAGASYAWTIVQMSTDCLYGSGLPSGFANLDHVPPYLVVNAGVGLSFDIWQDEKPLALRFDVVNLFDRSYLLRSGDGIGQFAPQYGARRGFFAGVSQKL